MLVEVQLSQIIPTFMFTQILSLILLVALAQVHPLNTQQVAQIMCALVLSNLPNKAVEVAEVVTLKN